MCFCWKRTHQFSLDSWFHNFPFFARSKSKCYKKLHVLCVLYEYELILNSYLPAKPELNCLKATAKLCTLWLYCQRKHFTHLLSKIGIKHVFSTIFSTVLELLQTVYREKTELQQSGISLNLRTGPTGHAPLFNQWDGALVFINKQIKTSPQSSKSFKTTDGVGQN